MVDPDPPREPAPKLVFFDLDGTISRHDTLIGYVWGYARRHPWRIPGFLRVLPALLGFLLGRLDRGELKGALIRGVMQGGRRQSIDEWTHAYIAQLIERGCFREALRAIGSHRQAGDHLILMSATVDLYVPSLAKALNFDEWICSEVRWNGERLDGRLASPNVRDAEKVHRLRACLPRFQGRRLVGYGNSHADLPHLRLVDEAVVVNAGTRLRRAAAELPVRFVDWL